MGIIKKLSQKDIIHIAAGEVVERPAHVLKELLENSLDAGATAITIMLEQGGLDLIRVIDNGCGMDNSDVELAIEHHTTSKINSCEDVAMVTTFGFRGEALSSIAAVSHLTIATQQRGTESGIRLTHDQEYRQMQPICMAVGSDIGVKQLFKNVPARKKFLKSPSIEGRACALLVQAFSFIHVNCAWRLLSEGKIVYSLIANQPLVDRALNFWGIEHKEQILSFVHTQDDINVEGCLSTHQLHRFDRSHIFLYVNNRWIRNNKLVSAVLRGYYEVLPAGRFPYVIMHIKIAHELVDVNVHPKKEEVAFVNSRVVETAVFNAVRKALAQHIAVHISRPQFSTQSFVSNDATRDASFAQKNYSSVPISVEKWRAIDTVQQNIVPISPQTAIDPIGVDKQIERTIYNNPDIDSELLVTIPTYQESIVSAEYHLIGQLYNTYILAHYQNGLLLVDQHAAHECVLYERYSKQHVISSTELTVPHIILLAPADIQVLHEYQSVLEDCGISFTQISSTGIAINRLPISGYRIDATVIIKELVADIIKEHAVGSSDIMFRIRHAACALMACKAAIKAGDPLSKKDMEQLLLDLQSTQQRVQCPHGRPTIWQLSLSEIEKKFKRRT